MKSEEGKSKPRDICERTFAFSLRVLKLVNQIPQSVAGSIIARQLMRAALSVGANTEEARGSTTKKEFARKMGIALSEAREALYWLRLISEGGLVPKSRLTLLVNESDELVRILVAIVKKSKLS